MRKNHILWSFAFLVVLFAFLLTPLAKADIYIKKTKHTDAVKMMGQKQPAKDQEGTTWISKDKMREDMEDSSTIIRFDLQKIFIINHPKKTYSEIDLPIDLEKIIPSQAKQMLQTLQVTADVTETGKTQKINNWNCKKYLVEISASLLGMNMPIKIEIWASKDLGIDPDIHKKFSKELLSLNPMTKGLSEEFEKMEGYPVRTLFSMTVMGTETKFREEVVSVEKKDAPAGTYELPEGFTKTAFNPFEQNM